MNNYFMSQTELFKGIKENDIEKAIQCLNGYHKSFKKGEVIFRIGDNPEIMGLILKGSLHIEINDVLGNTNIIGYFESGDTFSETYACLPEEKMMVEVIANEDSEILFLSVNQIIGTCSFHCFHHQQIIRNLISVIAKKNLHLTKKIQHISSKTIRERLLSYLSFESIQNNAYEFDIPFNRQQLADYLCVNRSAMSNELSKMQRDGIINFHKNHFIIKIKESPK